MTGALHGRSLVAVFAHPDDESLACGGLLATCADQGMKVSLVCATRGEDGHDASVASAGADLATVRTAELAAAADVLGVDAVTMLDFEDGMLPWLDGDDLEMAIAAAIERWAPDVVVTFDEDGLYWHPDHIAVHEATTAAVAAMAEGAPALYYASLPDGRMRSLVDAVRSRLPAPDVRVLGVADVDAFGTLAPPPDIVLHVEGRAARKLAALRCHQTQTGGGPFSVLTDAEAEQWLGVEHLRRAPVGNTHDRLIEALTEQS